MKMCAVIKENRLTTEIDNYTTFGFFSRKFMTFSLNKDIFMSLSNKLKFNRVLQDP